MKKGYENINVGRCGLCQGPLYEDDDIIDFEGERCHRECAEAEYDEEFAYYA